MGIPVYPHPIPLPKEEGAGGWNTAIGFATEAVPGSSRHASCIYQY